MLATHIRALVTLCALIGIATPCLADDASAVQNAVNDLYAKLDAGDAAGFSAYVPEKGFSEFNPDNAGLATLDLNYFKHAMSSGAKIDLRVIDLKVRVLGRAAVTTGYRVGSITLPQGQHIDSNDCLTMVWLKENDGWKLQHVHLSPRPPEKKQP